MASEQNLLAACIVDRHAYDMLTMHIGSQEFSPLGQHWLKQVEAYYTRDPEAKSCDPAILRQLGLQDMNNSQHRETLTDFYDNIPIIGASSQNILASVIEYQRQQTGLRLATAITSPNVSEAEMRTLLEEYNELLRVGESGLNKIDYVDYDSLGEFYEEGNRVPLFPRSLWKRKLVGGGALPGQHIVVYGRPEQGKTMFCIFQAACMAAAGYKVLYLVNEETAKLHAARAACSMAGVPIHKFDEMHSTIIAKARKKGLDNIRFHHMEPGTFSEIEAAIIDCEPQVVFLDQLAGVELGESNPVRAMDLAARRFRTLIGAYGIVGISVAQAGDRTERHGQEPPAYLSMADVYGSRTGLPAQADLMIGIGSDEDMRERSIRAISLPKNKLGGDHGGFPVRYDLARNRITVL